MKGKSVALFLGSIILICLWVVPVFAVSDSLVISKVYYSDLGSQWVELYNTSDNDIDLTSVSLSLQASSPAGSWTGSIPPITISTLVDSSNSVIKAHNSFLISTTATVSTEVGGETVVVTPNLYYADGLLATTPTSMHPVRGLRIWLDGVIVDSLLYGKAYEEGEESNPDQLDSTEFYSGSEPENETPIVETVPYGWGLVRVTNTQGEPVDTDENNTATTTGSDWEAVILDAMDPTPGPEVIITNPPVGEVISCDVGTTSCLVSWSCSNYDTYQILWKSVGDTEWNQVNGMALIDVTVDSGIITFEDFNADPDMPSGDFDTISNRLYKLVLVKN